MEINEGAHALTLECPACERQVSFQIEIGARLSVDNLNGGRLKPVMSTKSVEHSCNSEIQPELAFGGGDVFDDDEPDQATIADTAAVFSIGGN